MLDQHPVYEKSGGGVMLDATICTKDGCYGHNAD
jgi:hypothetical protein